jgi:hypothetical protein
LNGIRKKHHFLLVLHEVQVVLGLVGLLLVVVLLLVLFRQLVEMLVME